VIVPIFYSDDQKAKIFDKMRFFGAALEKVGLSVTIDDRPQYTPGWKFNEWEMKGVPLRLELGPRDMEKNQVTAVRRDTRQKIPLSEEGLVDKVISLLDEIQNNMFKKAKSFLDEHIKTASEYESFKKIIENDGGFVRVCWCSDQTCEQKIKEETGATIRLLPFEKEDTFSQCVYCGKKANVVAYFARAY